MAKVLVTGGTGLVGKQLCRVLSERGYELAILSRSGQSGHNLPVYHWDVDKGTIDPEAVRSADYIVHLAGTNMGGRRWTKKRKKQIVDSRVKSAEIIFDQVQALTKKPKAYITASATGYYGAISGEEIYNEESAAADDFLGQTCKAWEQLADQYASIGVRSVKIRTGIVLSKAHGALSKLKIPIQLGFGAAFGSGRQYMPWIHIDDLCNIYLQAIEDTRLIGPYNAVAPGHITNIEFTRKLAGVLKKPLWMPKIPSLALRLFLGEMSHMLLYGSRVSSEKILSSGFQFLYPDLESALRN